MVRRISIWAYFLLAVLLTGCPRYHRLSIVNRSGIDLELHLKDAVIGWSKGDIVTFGRNSAFGFDSLQPKQTSSGRGALTLVVSWRDQLLRYELLAGAPEGYTSEDDDGTLVTTLQLEPDRSIYILRDGRTVKSAEIPPQPEGFPLRPIVEAGHIDSL
jgi:hypothetical protein